MPLLCGLFLLQGLLFIPYAGVQNDEALFAAGIYQPVRVEYEISLSHHAIPIMLMSYLGALKAWVYTVIFRIWPPSPYSIRVPVLVFGAAAIGLLHLLLRKTAGRRVALVACALLATDTTFLMTNCFDWGPVALQHLLLVSGALLIWQFYATGRLAYLATGFTVFGLGLWDKALFVWVLIGLAVATAAVFPRELFSRLTRRNLAVAILGLSIGGAPLAVYNIARPFKTGEMARFSADWIGIKAAMVRSALDGSSLFGYIVRYEPPKRSEPPSAIERWPVALSDAAAEPRHSLLAATLAAALLLFPWVWRTPMRRPALFALVFLAATWLQMAFTQDAGMATHHTVLLWPFPHVLIAAVLAGISERLGRPGAAVLTAFVLVVCASNVLVTNQYLAQFIEYGPEPVWTDAIYPLSDSVEKIDAGKLYVMDWGIMNVLRVLNRGRLPLFVGSDPLAKDTIGDGDRRLVRQMLAEEHAVFLGHTEGNEIFAGVDKRMQAVSQAFGYHKQVLHVIGDRNGHRVYEVYRYQAMQPARRLTSP